MHSGQSSSQDDSVIDKAEILFSRVRSVTTEHLCNVKFNVHELRWISSALLPKHWFCVYAGPVHVRGVVAVWSCDGFVEQHSDGAASAAVLLTVQWRIWSIVQYCSVLCSIVQRGGIYGGVAVEEFIVQPQQEQPAGKGLTVIHTVHTDTLMHIIHTDTLH